MRAVESVEDERTSFKGVILRISGHVICEPYQQEGAKVNWPHWHWPHFVQYRSEVVVSVSEKRVICLVGTEKRPR